MLYKGCLTVSKGHLYFGGFLFAIGIILLILTMTLYFEMSLLIIAFLMMYTSTFWFLSGIQNLKDGGLHYPYTAFLSGTYSLAFLLLITAPFFFITEGSAIRPMGWVGCVWIVGRISFVSGLVFSILGVTVGKNKRWLLNISALLYCLSVHWIINMVLDLGVKVRGLILSS